MSLDLDESIDLSASRTVRLAGRDFYVAPLSLRQILAIADHVPKLSGVTAETMSGERLMPLVEVLWHGLRRAHPKLTREEFLDLPIPLGAAGGDRAGRRPEGGCGRGGIEGGERFESADWRALVAELVIELQWSRDQVLDQVDLLFLEDLRRAWADAPPLRRLLAAFLGHKPRPRPSKNYRELLAMFPGGLIQ